MNGSKTKTVHACAECGTGHPKWTGQCTGCGAWNTLVEEVVGPAGAPAASAMALAELELLHDIDALLAQPQPTGIGELDRVLGGGVVPGSVTLLGGEPGIGKSTLLLQLVAWWPGSALYVSAEESPQQVRLRAERLGAVRPDLWLTADTLARRRRRRHRPGPARLVVVDSIQTVADPRLTASAGSVVQVRECAQQLVAEAKRRNVAVVLVGHVTKDGALAGPRVLEHVVDTVLSFEGDRHHALRLLRAVKHRFGSTDELGLFEMTGGRSHRRARRVAAVPRRSPRRCRRLGRGAGDGRHSTTARRGPGAHRARAVPGARPAQRQRARQRPAGPPARRARASCRPAPRRPRRVRVDRGRRPPRSSPAPTSPSPSPSPARSPSGRSPRDLVLMGELGLTGEVRQVAHARRRLAEAARLGFRRAVVPAGSPTSTASSCSGPSTVGEALAAAGLAGGPAGPGSAAEDPAPRIAPWSAGNAPPTTSCATPSRGCAPGTPLRDGIDRVVRAKAGALLVLDDGPAVLAICSGGLPGRRAVQPATAVRAGEDGRRHHHLHRRRAHRPGQRPPRPRLDGAHQRDGHPPPHRRARRPVARGAGDLGQRGDGRHQRLRRRLQAPAPGRQPAARPGQPGAADARALQGRASTTPSPTSPASSWRTS